MIGLGPGTYNQLLSFEKNILPFVSLFKTYRNRWTSEFGIETDKNNAPPTQKDLLEYWNKYQLALKAYENISSIQKQRGNSLPKIFTPPYRVRYSDKIRNTLAIVKYKLIAKLKKNNIIVKE
jgi:hypothetical protein